MGTAITCHALAGNKTSLKGLKAWKKQVHKRGSFSWPSRLHPLTNTEAVIQRIQIESDVCWFLPLTCKNCSRPQSPDGSNKKHCRWLCSPLIASTASAVAFRAIQDWDKLATEVAGILQYIPRYSANLGWEQGYMMLYKPCIAKSSQKRKPIISKKVLQKLKKSLVASFCWAPQETHKRCESTFFLSLVPMCILTTRHKLGDRFQTLKKHSGMAESVSNQGFARKKCYNGISRLNQKN